MTVSERNGDRRNDGPAPAEMVLEGIRLWTRGQALRSTAPWSRAQRLYRHALGDEMGEQAIVALARFIAVLGRCASCPLRTFPAEAAVVSHDEVLMLGLVAGIQNGDETCVDFCLARLCCRTMCEEVASAAGVFAVTMKACRKVMRPMPVPVLERIIRSSSGAGDSSVPVVTLH